MSLRPVDATITIDGKLIEQPNPGVRFVPGGVFVNPAQALKEREKLAARARARSLILRSLPGIVGS